VTKEEEKAEVLGVFFVSVFNSKGSCSQGTQPPEQKDRNGKQKETPTICRETVSDQLLHIDTHKSMELDGIYPRVLKELTNVLAKPLSIVLAVLGNRGGPKQLEVS